MNDIRMRRGLSILLLLLLTSYLFAYEEVEIDGIWYRLDGDSATVVHRYEEEYEGNIVIPSSVEYKKKKHKVTTIGSFAFSWHDRLKSVIISDGVTTIEENAFYECSGLTSVTIPNSVTVIKGFAFGGCYNLTSITIPNSVMTVGYSAFYDCAGLTSVVLSNGSANISNDAFSSCKSLKYISVPRDFDLKKLNLPEGIEVTNTPIVFSELVIDSIKYEGEKNGGDIHCDEKGILYALVRNSAYGKAKGAVAKINVSGSTKGIAIPKLQKLGDLLPKQSAWIMIPIETTDQTIDGVINVKIVVRDDYGVESNEKEIEIKTHKLPLPDLRIVSHQLLMDYDTVLTKNKIFELRVSLKNEGEAIASNHRLKVIIPEGIKVVSESNTMIPDVSVGDEIQETVVFYTSAIAKNILDVNFEIENSVKEQVNNYDVHLEFGKTKAEPKNVIQRSAQKSVAVDSMVITENITLQQFTSLELTRNEWSKYKSNYAILKIRITGAKPEIKRKAKELLNVDLGSQLAAKSVYKGESNEVWFLIPVDIPGIRLTCGDGCREIDVWKGNLENNKVYSGVIRVY